MTKPNKVTDEEAAEAYRWMTGRWIPECVGRATTCARIIDEWREMKRKNEQDEAVAAGWAAIEKSAGHKIQDDKPGEKKKELPSGFGFEGIIPPGSPLLEADKRIEALSERIENIAKAIGGVPRYEAVCELVGRVERLETLPGRLKDDVESLSASIALLEDDGNAAELARRVTELESRVAMVRASYEPNMASVQERLHWIEQERAADEQQLANMRTWFGDIKKTCETLARDYKDVNTAAKFVREALKYTVNTEHPGYPNTHADPAAPDTNPKADGTWSDESKKDWHQKLERERMATIKKSDDKEVCKACKGFGDYFDTAVFRKLKCPNCGGSGLAKDDPAEQKPIRCPTCYGNKGWHNPEMTHFTKCETCGGTGVV